MQLSLIALLSLMKARGIHAFHFPASPKLDGFECWPDDTLRMHSRFMREPSYTLNNTAISLVELEKVLWSVTKDAFWEVCEYPSEGEITNLGMAKPFLYLRKHAAQPTEGRSGGHIKMTFQAPDFDPAALDKAIRRAHLGDACDACDAKEEGRADSTGNAGESSEQCAESPVTALRRMLADVRARADSLVDQVDAKQKVINGLENEARSVRGVLLDHLTNLKATGTDNTTTTTLVHRLASIYSGKVANLQEMNDKQAGLIGEYQSSNRDSLQTKVDRLESEAQTIRQKLQSILVSHGLAPCGKLNVIPMVEALVTHMRSVASDRIATVTRCNDQQADSLEQIRAVVGGSDVGGDFNLVNSVKALAGTKFGLLWKTEKAKNEDLQKRLDSQAQSLAEVCKVVDGATPATTIAQTVQTVIDGLRNRNADLISTNEKQFGDICRLNGEVELAISELNRVTNPVFGMDYAAGVWVEGKYCQDRLFHAIATAVQIMQGRVSINAKDFDAHMAASNPKNCDETVSCRFSVTSDSAGATTIKAIGDITINAVGNVVLKSPEVVVQDAVVALAEGQAHMPDTGRDSFADLDTSDV